MTYPHIDPEIPASDIVSPNSDPESDLEGNEFPEDDETEEDILQDEDEEPEDEDLALIDATGNRS